MRVPVILLTGICLGVGSCNPDSTNHAIFRVSLYQSSLKLAQETRWPVPHASEYKFTKGVYVGGKYSHWKTVYRHDDDCVGPRYIP
ncbi:hypothetical protein BJ138DRAFT_1155709, partial [Hygrophoropsis aurantiaca]